MPTRSSTDAPTTRIGSEAHLYPPLDARIPYPLLQRSCNPGVTLRKHQ